MIFVLIVKSIVMMKTSLWVSRQDTLFGGMDGAEISGFSQEKIFSSCEKAFFSIGNFELYESTQLDYGDQHFGQLF